MTQLVSAIYKGPKEAPFHNVSAFTTPTWRQVRLTRLNTWMVMIVIEGEVTWQWLLGRSKPQNIPKTFSKLHQKISGFFPQRHILKTHEVVTTCMSGIRSDHPTATLPRSSVKQDEPWAVLEFEHLRIGSAKICSQNGTKNHEDRYEDQTWVVGT